MLGRFDRVFVTYDLDAHGDVSTSLNQIGLRERTDYVALGLRQAGKKCIEGLLPPSVLAAVNGRETDSVMGLM